MVKKYDSEEFEKCPIIYAMDIIGSKWKLPILWNLTREDNLHYNELKRRIRGITNTMLTRALRQLMDDGIIERHCAGTVPPSVTYSLTEIGYQLLPSLDSLYAWGEVHQKLKSKNQI